MGTSNELFTHSLSSRVLRGASLVHNRLLERALIDHALNIHIIYKYGGCTQFRIPPTDFVEVGVVFRKEQLQAVEKNPTTPQVSYRYAPRRATFRQAITSFIIYRYMT